MADKLQDAIVIRNDGVRGRVVSVLPGKGNASLLEVAFDDATRLMVPSDVLTRNNDGSYKLPLGHYSAATSTRATVAPASVAPAAAVIPADDDMTIEVVAEDLEITKERVERGRVRAIKRIETFDQVVDTPTTSEEVVVDRIAKNVFVDDEAPRVREEDGILIIPLLEEVLVVEKRLFLREEVRVSKRLKTVAQQQTVTLRREIVDIERVDASGRPLAATEASAQPANAG